MTSIYDAYLEALGTDAARIQETAQPSNELEWQARWFSGACGRQFTTTDGQEAVILDFGEWNREAGPDFVRATVRRAGQETTGAIEVDLTASGWEQHHHATNPNYSNVILHVFVHRPSRRHFSRTSDHTEVPQVCLADHALAGAEWDAGANARPGRCMAPLRQLPTPKLLDLLAAAARRRFEKKGVILETMAASRGMDAALYESVAVALGYKHNKLPFQLLAQRIPRRLAASPHGQALLFGVAGFLDRPAPPSGPALKTTTALWASWWKQHAAFTHFILPRSAWHHANVRPANHPLRRIAALRAIACHWKFIRPALESADLSQLADNLFALQDPFWSFHTTWQSSRQCGPLALLGSSRILGIYGNIALPLAFLRGKIPKNWRDIPAAEPNTTLKTVTTRLFGPEPRRLPLKLFVQQGLLQIYRDFCLHDHHGCENCKFPALIERLAD